MTWTPACLPTGIGSLPHTDATAARTLIEDCFSAIPFWPQLPQRTGVENMYVQYSELLPNRFVTETEGRVTIETAEPDLAAMETFYERYLAEDLDAFAISEEYAAGLTSFLSEPPGGDGVLAVKGQTTGPISFGLMVTDENRKAILHSDVFRDLYLKNLQMKARWQERALAEVAPGARTIMFIDEPYLSAIGSAVVNLNPSAVADQLREVIAKCEGLTGIHCCGNTDWSLLLELPFDILSFDAFAYGDNLLLFSDALAGFLDRGGIIAWGIVPSTTDEVLGENVASLAARFERLITAAVDKGFDRDVLLAQALITPSCGVGSVEPVIAERVFTFTRDLAAQLRADNGLAGA